MLFKSLKRIIAICVLVSPLLTYSQLSGTYTVGVLGGEDFSSLTNAGGFFDAVNGGVLGNINLQVTSDLLNESGTYSIDQWAGPWTITIVPQTPSVKTIQHLGCSNHLILMNKADNLTIDGRFNQTGTDRFLHFNSACNNRSVFRLEGDCQNVTIRNCVIASDNNQTSVANGGAIHVDDTQTLGSDNLVIRDNLIRDYSGLIDMFDGVQISAPGTTGAALTGLVVEGNEFVNFDGKGLYLMDEAGEILAANIYRNSFYSSGTVDGPGTGWAFCTIQIETGSGHVVRSNWIGGSGPNCSGAKMDISLSAGTQLITFIRMKDDLPNAAVNLIDSNIVRNINIQSSTSDDLKCSLIRLENGNNNVGGSEPNFLGDIGVNASSAATASIVVDCLNNSNSHDFRAIYDTSSGSTTIMNNHIGGMLFENTSTYPVEVNLIYSYDNGSGVNISNNIIGGVANNIVQETHQDLRAIYLNQNDVNMIVSDNAISGIRTTGDFSDDFYGIRISSGSGSSTVQNNIISDCIISGGTSARMYGIGIENPNSVINNNTIENISIYSSMNGAQFYGIRVIESSTSIDIIDNNIQSVSLLNSASTPFNIIGIFTSGSNSTFNIRKNYLAAFRTNSTSNSTYIRGISVGASSVSNVYNNVVLMDNGGNTNDLYLYGIFSSSSSGVHNIFFNTVDIRGNATGSRRSACLYVGSSCTRNDQSNIFNNKRTGGGGDHYSIYHASTSGTLTHDYNLLHVDSDLSKLVYYSGNRDFAQWQSLGFAVNSISPYTTVDLVDATTGLPTTDLGVDVANGGLGINDDHVYVGRPIDLGHDMGAFEIPIDSLPPWILPVGLIDFKGECIAEVINLTWSTKSEFDNDYFVVEQSVNGKNWFEVAQVQGVGNSIYQTDYQVVVDQSSIKAQFYRLKQVDFNGESETFYPIKVQCTGSGNCEKFFFEFHQENSSIVLNADCLIGSDADVFIYDMTGKLISEGVGNVIYLENSLESGLYLIRIFNKGIVRSGKFLVD